MALALPGAKGLFSHLQVALKSCVSRRLRLTPSFHHALPDFRWMHDELASRPTRLQELVPTSPSLQGTHDAAGSGAGGVWFPTSSTQARAARVTILEPSGHFHRVRQPDAGPVVWWTPFPPAIRPLLASSTNPTGPINNSQLELIGAFGTTKPPPNALTFGKELSTPGPTTSVPCSGIAKVPSQQLPPLPPSYVNKRYIKGFIETT